MNPVTPKVSVIIPAFNAGHCLRACLDSVLAQEFTDWEAVVVDDGSTDDTAAVAQAYTDRRIRYQRQDNAGQGAARNRGLGMAGGELVAFLDADDEWLPEFLARTVAFLATHPQAVAVSTGFIVRYGDGSQSVRPEAGRSMQETQLLDDFFSFWADHDHVRTGTVLIRRPVIDLAGPQRADLRISQDLEYWGYLATFGAWGFIPEPLWVGNSRAAAGAGGWLRKYRHRRRLCPTVTAWQSRIVPRLAPADWPGFRRVRGRVAAGFAHHMILGGLRAQARDTVREFGAEMPVTPVSRLLRLGDRLGPVGWALACTAVILKEYAKAARMWLGRR